MLAIVTMAFWVLMSPLSIALALSHDSQALAALAFLGGFLTPWLLRGGGGYAVLLSTNVLLNLAALAFCSSGNPGLSCPF